MDCVGEKIFIQTQVLAGDESASVVIWEVQAALNPGQRLQPRMGVNRRMSISNGTIPVGTSRSEANLDSGEVNSASATRDSSVALEEACDGQDKGLVRHSAPKFSSS